MSDPSTPSTPIVADYARPPGGTFIQRAVLDALGAMTKGHLRLELPGGAVREFGSRETETTLPLGLPAFAAIRVLRPEFFGKCFWSGDIGFAESFIDGDWETPDLAGVIAWFILNVDTAPTLSGSQRARSVAERIIENFIRKIPFLITKLCLVILVGKCLLRKFK